jgi:hypothetical protein
VSAQAWKRDYGRERFRNFKGGRIKRFDEKRPLWRSGPLERFAEICQILFDIRRGQAANLDMEGRNIFLKMHFEREHH